MVSYIRNVFRNSRHIAISFVKSPGIPCLQWRNQTGMHDSSCLSNGFLFYACRQTRVEQTGNNVFQLFEPKKKEEEKRFDLKKIGRRRRTGNSQHFLSLFIAVCTCETCLQRQRVVWSLFSAWPGPISDKLSCAITTGSLAHQWTEATLLGGLVVRLRAKTAPSRKNQHWGPGRCPAMKNY